ncbi:MAG: hypothetical protein QMD36_05340 [Candidatus Aenigmarchaeota archaeon]|nr:hypothetical protein [Candidatus Aenigmarchaeota archaeon]
MANYGSWAFIIGVILAIILGLFGQVMVGYKGYITAILVIIGLIVGFANITEKEATNFLIAAIALLATNTVTQWTSLLVVGDYIAGILGGIGTFVAPAAVLVALKAIYDLAYKKK